MTTGMGGLPGLVVRVLDMVAIVSVLRGSAAPAGKLLWVVVIVLLPLLGMMVYFVMGRSTADARSVAGRVLPGRPPAQHPPIPGDPTATPRGTTT